MAECSGDPEHFDIFTGVATEELSIVIVGDEALSHPPPPPLTICNPPWLKIIYAQGLFGYFLTIWAFLSKQLTGHYNSHRTINLWFNEEKQFHLIFTTYQNYPLALTMTIIELTSVCLCVCVSVCLSAFDSTAVLLLWYCYSNPYSFGIPYKTLACINIISCGSLRVFSPPDLLFHFRRWSLIKSTTNRVYLMRITTADEKRNNLKAR